jgi:indolepyruvate decarboxylase
VRNKFPTVVIVLDNKGYGTERLLHAGDWKFNDIPHWHFHKLPELVGGGKGYLVHTEGEFDAALNAAWKEQSTPSILQVVIDPADCSRALARMGERMSKTVVQK